MPAAAVMLLIQIGFGLGFLRRRCRPGLGTGGGDEGVAGCGGLHCAGEREIRAGLMGLGGDEEGFVLLVPPRHDMTSWEVVWCCGQEWLLLMGGSWLTSQPTSNLP